MPSDADIRALPLVVAFHPAGNEEEDTRVRRLAGLLPGFRREDAGNNREGRVRLSVAEAGVFRDVLLDLWSLVKDRPGSVLRLGEERATLAQLKDAFVVLDCAAACDKARNAEEYCTSVRSDWNWGCIHLRHLPPSPGPGENKPDKNLLKQRLRTVAVEKQLLLCPRFDLNRVDALVDAWRGTKPPLEASRTGDLERSAHAVDRDGQDFVSPRPAPEGAIPLTTYADVGGLDQAIAVLRETVELPLKHPEVLRRLGVAPHRGVLLYGPPGCGKTLLARAVAHESEASFLPVSGPELITKWHGESEEKLRALFVEAGRRQPAIVFFDEIDAVAQSRSADESLRLDSRFTAQLLTLMDGIRDLGRVLVLAATNRLDLLDKALLRPGRFDRLVEIARPDRAGCLKILSLHAGRLPLAESVDLTALARKLDGSTGADIACLAREAAYACLRRTFGLPDLLRESAALPEDKLRGLQVTAGDFLFALGAMRGRKAAVEAQDAGAGPAGEQSEKLCASSDRSRRGTRKRQG